MRSAPAGPHPIEEVLVIRSLRVLIIAALALGTLLAGTFSAAADPWEDCGPHSLEDKVVRVFPRGPSEAGPTGDTATLECGNRYYGLGRLAPQWSGAGPEWRAVADAALARTLAGAAAPAYEARSNTWVYTSPEAVVVLGPGGVVVDARPASR
jgi:hypothetical protein